IGACVMTITNTNFSGAAGTQFSRISPSNFPVTVQVGDSVRIIVKFTPSSIGSKTAKMSIINSTAFNPWDVNLYAQKDSINFKLEGITSLDTLNFGMVCPKTVKDTIFKIRNISTIRTKFSHTTPGIPFTVETPDPTGIPFDTNQVSEVKVRCTAAADTGVFVKILTIKDTCGKTKRVILKATIRRPFTEMDDRFNICYGDTIQIGSDAFGGSPPYTYSWYPPLNLSSSTAAAPYAFPKASTLYIVTISDKYGCTSLDTVDVRVFPRIDVDAGTNITICSDSVVTLQGKVSGGKQPYISMNWEPAGDLNGANSLTPTMKYDTSGTYKFFLTVTDANNCKATDSVTVRIRSAPQINFSINELDFGTLDPCASSKTDTIWLKNNVMDVVSFDSVRFDAGFKKTSPNFPVSINPGDSVKINVMFDSGIIGETTGTLLFYGGPCYFESSISAKGFKNELLIQKYPENFDFGQSVACEDVNLFDTLTIKNTGKDNISIDLNKISINSPFNIDASPGFTVIPAGDSLIIGINYTPDNTVSNYIETMKIPYTAGSCRDTLHISINGSRVEPNLESLSTGIDFPPMLGCTDCTDTVLSIINNGLIPLSITHITPQPEFKTTETLPFEIQPNETKSFKITFCPKDLGTYTGNLSLNYQPCEKALSFAVTGSKEGIVINTSDTIDLGEIIYCNTQSVSLADSVIYISSGSSDGTITMVEANAPFRTSLQTGNTLNSSNPARFTVFFETDGSLPDGEYISQLNLTFEPCNMKKTINLKGRKSDVKLTGSGNIDFGQIIEAGTASSELTIKNTGAAADTIDGFTGIAPPFALIGKNPALPASLQPGETLSATFTYNPSKPGTDTLTVYANSSKPCNLSVLSQLKGSAKQSVIIGSAEVYIQSDSASAGEIVNLPLLLRSSQNLAESGVTGFKAKIRMNKSLLKPTFTVSGESFAGGERIFEIEGTWQGGSALAQLNYNAALGDIDCAPVIIDTLEWIGGLVNTTKEDGTFCLKGICRKNGDRYFTDQGQVALYECKPNPAEGNIEFEFETLEEAPAKLFIVNSVGIKVADVYEVSAAGYYKANFDTKDLASGLYFYILQTPTIKLSKRMWIIK
ncbi:MAG: Choice-of-anchor protein, partial [Bacteroidota bacterium]|nr:Choice-of-anchor protein [Bacteroidota bacterium]